MDVNLVVTIVVLCLIAYGALYTHFRRWKDMGGFWSLVLQGIWWAAYCSLLGPVQREFARLPKATQAIIQSRQHDIAFLFWLIVFSIVAFSGVIALGLSFRVLNPEGPSQRDAELESQGSRPTLLRRLTPFGDGYFWLLTHRGELSAAERAVICLHHALFSAAMLAFAAVGLALTVGFPWRLLWLYLLGSGAAAVLLHPVRSDRKRLARLTDSPVLRRLTGA